jgi:hypothetical protein
MYIYTVMNVVMDKLQGLNWIVVLTYIILISVIAYIIYYVYSYFHDIHRLVKCLSLSNLFSGEIIHCWDSTPEYCKDINPNLYYGYCMDPDYMGVYPGDETGAYGFDCENWISNPKRCPPLQCKGPYPIGIKTDGKDPPTQLYGWCGDSQVNRALKGTKCGVSPEVGIPCENWIWDESQCQKTCSNPSVKPKPIIKPKTKTKSKKPCSLVCGLVNGKMIPCPPPDCSGSEQCPCN